MNGATRPASVFGWVAAWMWLAAVLRAQPVPPTPLDTVARVRLEGQGLVHMDHAERVLAGSGLDSATLRRNLEAVVDTAVSRGFLTASLVARSAELTDSGIELRLEAVTGSRAVWGTLRDLGGSSLTPTALARIGNLPMGTPADPEDLRRAQQRLVQTGYVVSDGPSGLRRVPRTAMVDGLLRLKDIPSSYVEGAAGWQRDGGTMGYIEAQLANIAGTARDLAFGISQGEQGTLAHLRYKEPWVLSLAANLVMIGSLATDSLSQAMEGSIDLMWPVLDGRMEFGLGLSMARRAERAPSDTLFGPTSREFGTRFSGIGRRNPPSVWPVGDVVGTLVVETVALDSDTGSGVRVRVRTGVDTWLPLGLFTVRVGAQARGIWPLDRSAGLSEALAPGGIEGWRGWPEGSPRSPSWGWLTTQVGIGSARSGGVFGFWEPGVRARRRPDLDWESAWGWSVGTGFSVQLPTWRIELVIAARDETPAWQDALLQVRARNRF